MHKKATDREMRGEGEGKQRERIGEEGKDTTKQARGRSEAWKGGTRSKHCRQHPAQTLD